MLTLVELLKLCLAAKKTDMDSYARTMLIMKTKRIKNKDTLRKEAYYVNRHLLTIYYIQGIFGKLLRLPSGGLWSTGDVHTSSLPELPC